MSKGTIAGFIALIVGLVLLMVGSMYIANPSRDISPNDPLVVYANYPDIAKAAKANGGTINYIPEDTEQIKEYREGLRKMYGETWFSDYYKKEETEIPYVEAEETLEGELWFPPINNTAPLEEIAPVISYEHMLNGYLTSPYYPEDPENYTAAALNEKAFPIAFFRKVNDLCYYTVCKVEGGGYIYYFFSANSDADYEDAVKAAGLKAEYDKNRDVIVNQTTHLYNTTVSDAYKNRDLTKEVIWRGSVYATPDTGTVEEFTEKMMECYYSEKWYDRTPKYLADNVSKSFKPLLDVQDRLACNSGADHWSLITSYAFMRLNYNNSTGVLQTHHLCSDGYVTLNYELHDGSRGTRNGVKDGGTLHFRDIFTDGRLEDYIVTNRYSLESVSLQEQIQEYNSYSIKILPQDNICAK